MTMLASPDPGLMFGPLNLIGTDAEQAAQGYKFEALSDTAFGNPVSIVQKVISWLQDGALVSKSGDDNRDGMSIPVRIAGDDSNKLALGEKALMLQTGIRNTLTWTPPDGQGEPCVFDVIMSSLDYDFDDINELYTERAYILKLQCAPFVRSQEPVTVTIPAPSGTQVLTPVDDCSSFTGWAATRQGGTGTLTSGTAGGLVYATNSNATTMSSFNVRLVRSSLSADLTATPYIRVEVIVEKAGMSGAQQGSDLPAPKFTLNGILVPVAIQNGNIYWLDTTGLGLGSTLATFQVDLGFVRATQAGNQVSLEVQDISRSNVIGEPGTNRQLSRLVAVDGSARTQATILVTDASDALGDVLVYTSVTGGTMIQPNLRQYLTSGNATDIDTSTVSGLTSDLDDVHIFDLPAGDVQPGSFQLMARVKHATPGDYEVSWAAKSLMDSTAVAGQAGTATLSVDSSFGIFSIAELELPTRLVGVEGFVRIELSGPAGLILDEAWVFNKDTGNLTWVNCGTGTPGPGGVDSNRLWLNAATLDTPTPTVFVGWAASGADQVYPTELFSNDVHNIVPPVVNVFTVTTNSTESEVSLTHYPRWLTHVARAV